MIVRRWSAPIPGMELRSAGGSATLPALLGDPPLTLSTPFLSAALAVLEALGPPNSPRLDAPETLLAGERPHIRVSGLRPLSSVTLETFRPASVPVKEDGRWSTQPLRFHAQATFWADASGVVDVDRAPPVTGSYSGADPRGLLWSGAVVGRGAEPERPSASPELSGLQPRQIRLRAIVDGRMEATRDVKVIGFRADVGFTTVDTPQLVGVFAAPAGARRAPAIIVLHGSEGGEFASAKAAAGLWASHGYAALAVIYFSWPYEHVANAPPAFTDLPVERIDAARSWLRSRKEADVSRLGVVGGSKGAEFGLLAASRYPWIRAVAACVPSSLVWGGFGAAGGAHPPSFTFGGQPLPTVPYGDYGPVERDEITSAQRHVRDRAQARPAAVAAAAIPVERSHARLLLISGGRDAVWPSDAMASEIVNRMRSSGAAGRVIWRSYPDAGHYLCGTGDGPIRANDAEETARGGGLVSADGRDPGAAWEATLLFMKRALGLPRDRLRKTR